MDVVEDLINNFHNLEGTSLKERKKSLHNFFMSVQSLSSYYLDTLVQNLNTLNYSEETFKIDLLIYFKRTDDLQRILTSGEEIYSCRVIRQDWFIKDLVENYSSSKFVVELFPRFSLSLRMKVLKKILIYITDETKIQDLFHELHKTYGLKVALILITGCSSAMIQEFLSEYRCHLSSSQLKSLFDKDQSLIIIYFDVIKNNGGNIDNYKWISFFKYIGIKHPLFYYELTKKFGIKMCKLGRKSTKKFIDTQKANVLHKPLDYIAFLRKDSLVRKLGEDFPELYRNTLPKIPSPCNYHISRTLLKYYNKDKQYDLFCKTFEEKYNKSIWDNKDFMEERLIELVPAKEDRYKWIAKFENTGNINKYIIKKKYAKFQSRIVFIEDENVTIRERKTIFNTLISTCKLTRDYDAFLNILKSFCERHINSDVIILYNFLRTVHKELEMKNLKADHWKYIYDIISVQLFKKQQVFLPIFVEYIKFLFLQNNEIEQYISVLLKETQNLNLNDFRYGISEFEKAMLQFYIKLLHEMSNEGNLAMQVALRVISWNQKHSKDKIYISKQPDILHSVMKLRYINRVDHNAIRVLEYFICQQDGNPEISDLDAVYWDNFKYLNKNSITMWFAKNKPVVLKQNIDKIEMMLKTNNIVLIRILKKYDYLNMPSIITTFCLNELKHCVPTKSQSKIRIIVLFMPSEKLLQFFKEYFPQMNNSNDIIAEYDKQNFGIRCALMKYLKFTNNLKIILPDLLRNCHGDLFRFGLSSLYSSFCRIPENQLYSAIEYLEAQEVSLRKHSIYLTSLLLPIDKVLLKYQQVQELEKNSSVVQHMFLNCYKYFLKNILEESWIIMKKYIMNLDKCEKQIIDVLINVDKVPKQYRAVFTELAWQTFQKLKNENVKIDDNMISLLENLRENDITDLHHEFCANLISNNLFEFEKCSIELSVFSFTKKYVLYGENIEQKINMIFELLHKFKKSWLNNDNKIKGLKILNQFCFGLFENFFGHNKNEINSNFARLFRDAWTKEFTEEETFEENLLIDMILEIDSKGTLPPPERISDLFTAAFEKYGSLVLSNLKNVLSRTIYFICNGNDGGSQDIIFLKRFLEKNCSNEHCLLVIELLPPAIYVADSEIEYQNLIEILSQKSEAVRISLFGKLKSELY